MISRRSPSAFLLSHAAFETALLAVVAPVVTLGCAAVGQGDNADAGPGAAVADGGVNTPFTDAGAATGVSCAEDMQTQTYLCTAVSVCPGVNVNHTIFPHCGYRIVGTGYDLACWCDGYVCPMGVPTTCADTAQILENQNEATICAQIATGACSQPQLTSGSGRPASETTGSTVKPGCDRTCLRQCGPSQGCKDVCGC